MIWRLNGIESLKNNYSEWGVSFSVSIRGICATLLDLEGNSTINHKKFRKIIQQ